MKVELTEQDVTNLLLALNAVPVKGEDQMMAVLTLAQKLRSSLQPVVPVEEPKPVATKENVL